MTAYLHAANHAGLLLILPPRAHALALGTPRHPLQLFAAKEADAWWAANRARIMLHYSILPSDEEEGAGLSSINPSSSAAAGASLQQPQLQPQGQQQLQMQAQPQGIEPPMLASVAAGGSASLQAQCESPFSSATQGGFASPAGSTHELDAFGPVFAAGSWGGGEPGAAAAAAVPLQGDVHAPGASKLSCVTYAHR